MFDRDDHPNMKEAIDLCLQSGIGLALSNACFELWPLLHFLDVHANLHRHELQRRLREVHRPYHHDDGALIDWWALEVNLDEALKRATAQHVRAAKRPDALFENPFTTAWLLQLRLLHALDRDGGWFVDRCREHPALEKLADHLAEPMRTEVKTRLGG